MQGKAVAGWKGATTTTLSRHCFFEEATIAPRASQKDKEKKCKRRMGKEKEREGKKTKMKMERSLCVPSPWQPLLPPA